MARLCHLKRLYFLLKVLEKAYEKMSDREKRELLEELGAPNIATSLPAALPVMAIQGAIRMSGFAAYKLVLIVANAIVNSLVKPILGQGISLAANAALTRSVAAFAGPVGWAVTIGWSLYDLGGPAYRVLVPCVTYVSFLRQKYCACQSCWEVQPAMANFCQTCGAGIEPVQ